MLKKNLFLLEIALLFTEFIYSQEKYFMEENIDKSVNPGDDFFLYANGTFIKNHPIPASESLYGIFNLINDDVYDYLKKKGTVVTADLHPGFYRHIDPAVRQEDITALSFADGSFDLLVANPVLEHIPDDRRAMAECFRVLKPGGRAVLQVPYSVLLNDTLESPNIHDPDLQSVLYGQEDHVRIYALKDYMCRLEQAGFEVAMAKDPERTAMLAFATQPGEEFILVSKPGIISTSG